MSHRWIAPGSSSGPGRAALAVLPALVAIGLQWWLWPLLRPYAWVPSLPALFISSWYGGRRIGVATTLLCTVLIWWLFVPPEGDFAVKGEALPLIPAATFVATGIFMSFAHGRLRDTMRGLLENKERLRLAEALVRSQDDLNRAQAVAKIGSWRLDVHRDELVWSDESYRIFGVPPGTPMTYERFLACAHPDDRDFVDRMWQAALRGRHYDIEHRVIADDKVKWVREKADLAFDAEGKLLGGIGTTQDVTERKHADEALRRAHETERQLSLELEEVTRAGAAVSESVAGIPRSDLAAVLHTIALQARTITSAEYVALGIGVDPEKPFDPWITIGIPPEIAHRIGRSPRPIGVLGAVARGGKTIRMRDVKTHPSFGGLPAHHPDLRSFLGVPVAYQGRTMGNLYLANKRDADEFTEHDERLIVMLAARVGVAIETASLYTAEALQRAWLRAIIDHMPEGVVIRDERGRILLENEAALALRRDTGWTDPLGNPIVYDFRGPSGEPLPPDDLPLYRAIARGEHLAGSEHWMVDRDGRQVPVLVSATPLRVDDRPAGAVAVFQDISAMKELERMRDEWASVVAHDLRQPVGIIRLATDLLAQSIRGSAPSREQKALRSIASASERLRRMIDDLLDVSRIDARRLSVHPTSVDLAALVRDTVETLEPSLADHPVEVTASPSEPAWVDADRIEQVLGNLLSNASKYGEPATPIEVTVARRGEEVEVAVSNRGPGIPPDQLPLLFSRFARTPEARRSGVPGLGLGLYITHGLVEAHGGRLWAESVPCDRTTFRFTVPRTERAAPDPAPLPQ